MPEDCQPAGVLLRQQRCYGQVCGRRGNSVENLKTANIGRDGSAAISFDLPGSISGSALEGTVRIDATWGGVTEDAKVTVSGSVLRLSQGEVRSNESITIQGDGFGKRYVEAAKITIDGVPLRVDDDSKNSQDQVTVSNAGQFVVTVAVWPQDTSEDADNPALIAGTHTIRVEDKDGFFGTASLIIKEPKMTITPDVLGPRDYITITGTDWPVDNADGGSNTNVDVTIDDDARDEDRRYSVIPDATGRFVVEHRVSRNVGIPSTNQVRATYGEGGDIVKVASFKVPAATIEITPTQGQPGDEVTMTVEGMKVYAEVAGISIGGADVRGRAQFPHRPRRECDGRRAGHPRPGSRNLQRRDARRRRGRSDGGHRFHRRATGSGCGRGGACCRPRWKRWTTTWRRCSTSTMSARSGRSTILGRILPT